MALKQRSGWSEDHHGELRVYQEHNEGVNIMILRRVSTLGNWYRMESGSSCLLDQLLRGNLSEETFEQEWVRSEG
jgi:hypothetical protein